MRFLYFVHSVTWWFWFAVTVPSCATAIGGDATACPYCKTGPTCEEYIDRCDCISLEDDRSCDPGKECIDTDSGPQCQECDDADCYVKGCTISESCYFLSEILGDRSYHCRHEFAFI